MSAFDDLGSIRPLPVWDGVAARPVRSGRMTLTVIELDPGAVVPEHAHENEQVGVALAGSMRFRIGGEEREVSPGSTWSIPANVPHSVTVGPEGCVVAEVFAPGRDDWSAIQPDEARTPRWP
jgi:quercetin dioxygenase-like cupin family protein